MDCGLQYAILTISKVSGATSHKNTYRAGLIAQTITQNECNHKAQHVHRVCPQAHFGTNNVEHEARVRTHTKTHAHPNTNTRACTCAHPQYWLVPSQVCVRQKMTLRRRHSCPRIRRRRSSHVAPIWRGWMQGRPTYNIRSSLGITSDENPDWVINERTQRPSVSSSALVHVKAFHHAMRTYGHEISLIYNNKRWRQRHGSRQSLMTHAQHEKSLQWSQPTNDPINANWYMRCRTTCNTNASILVSLHSRNR